MSRNQPQPDNDLVSVGTPVLEMVMRIKAGIITPSSDLRHTIEQHLKQMEQRGEALGYKERQVQAAKFALTAFVDETVLMADFVLRDEWQKYPLQLEYFGEHLAGVKFFDRLDELLKDVDNDADVLEVYYLCLLLGYKGKYKRYREEELKGVIENVADHLRRANRLRAGALAPHWKTNDQPVIKSDTGLPQWLKVGGGAALGLVVLLYIVLDLWLSRDLNGAIDQLLR